MSGHAPFFFAEPAGLEADRLTIEGEDARHLAVVRRASTGDLIRISDGRGTIADARLTSVTPAAVGAEVLTRTVTPAPSPHVEVHQGLAKGDKVDGVIRHLVEMGVDFFMTALPMPEREPFAAEVMPAVRALRATR